MSGDEASEAKTLVPPDGAPAPTLAPPVGAVPLPLESRPGLPPGAPTQWTGPPPPAAAGAAPDSTRWTGAAAPSGQPASSPPAVRPRSSAGDVPASLGEYDVGEQLGEGGMGAVYRGTDRSLRRPVAIKVLSTRVLDDTRATERFLREARAAASVSHPNVITVFAVGQEAGRPYMAMELVTGGDAAQLACRSGGRLPERRALEIVRDCCKGLSAIERAGLVHRDIKPANIFIVEDGTAKLADLGLARSAAEGEDRMTQTGVVVGTPAYMSPEQAGGEEVDVRTDIWALGASLYELVSGRPPYSGSVMAVVKQVLTAPPPDPRAVSPPLSPLCCDVIRRAMAKEAVDRFPSALAMLEAVEAALAKTKAPRAGEGARIERRAEGAPARPPSARLAAPPPAPPTRPQAAPPPPVPPGGLSAGKLVGGLALFAGAVGLWALVSARGWGDRPADPTPAPPTAPVAATEPGPAPAAPVTSRRVDDGGLDDLEGPGLLVDDVVLDEGAPLALRSVGPGETARQQELVGSALPAPLRVTFTLSDVEVDRNRRAADAAEREAGLTEGAPGWAVHLGVRSDASPVGDPLALRAGSAVWVALYFERGGPIRGVVHERAGGKAAPLEAFRIDRFAAGRDDVRVVWTVAKNGWRAAVLVAGREGWARGRAWSVAAAREGWTPWAVAGAHRDGDGQGSLKASAVRLESNVAADLSAWRRPPEPAGPSGATDPAPAGTRRPRATPVTPQQPQPQPLPPPPPPPPPPRGGPPPRR